MTAQIDLSSHVFRSVRRWLHQLFPAEPILIEQRHEESLREGEETSAGRPVWHLRMLGGPTWAEHTGYSSMVSVTIEALRNSGGPFDAQAAAGTVVANSTRPRGRIPLIGFDLVYPQAPDLVADPTAGTLPATMAVAVVATDADGAARTAPSSPVLVSSGATSVLVTPHHWPPGPTLAEGWQVLAGPDADTLSVQAVIDAHDTLVLSELIEGDAPTTGTEVAMLGLRVTDSGAEVAERTGNGPATWNMRATLRLTAQVPSVAAVHLDDVLRP